MTQGVTPGEVAEHLDDLHRVALRLTRRPADAADLVQETVVRALERGDTYRGDAPLGAWLRRILHNLAVDRGKRSAREVPVAEVERRWADDAYTVDTAVVVDRAQTREDLEDALAHLPFIYRSTLVLHDADGMTLAEIADLQGASLPAVKQRLRRGRMALVTALAHGAELEHATRGVPLRCWDARRHVSEYLDGALDPQVAATVEAHLAGCPTCPPLYASLVGVKEELAELRDPDSVIPDDLKARLAEAGVSEG